MLKIIALIFTAEIFGSAGQVFFKKGAPDFEGAYLKFIKIVLGCPFIWLGLLCMATGMLIWITALAQVDLSLAYPIDSMQNILTVVAARIFLKEKLDIDKAIGTVLVVLGIILVAKS